MTPVVTAVQFAVTVCPVQNTKLSGMIPSSWIWFAVLAATVPVSIGVPVASVDVYVLMRT
jgi:hypothetical protein